MSASADALTDRWIDVGALADVPRQGARIVRTPQGEIGVFRTAGDAVYALDNRCPHRGGPLAEGIVHGAAVSCPLHNWVIDLASGAALGADEGCVATFPCRVDNGRILLCLRAWAEDAA
jgi:nitrite reductase (NADH) small subunit